MVTPVRVRIAGLAVVLSPAACGHGSHGSTSAPERRAATDVARSLDAFRSPPGSAHSGSRPAGTPKELDEPMTRPNTPNLVTRTGWWTTSGTPDSVISWESAHPPEGMRANGTSTLTSGQRTDELTLTLAASPIPAVLPSRNLLVQAARLTNGRTVIRVDAQDTWLAAKSAAETIPPAAVLTIRPITSPHFRPPPAPTPTAPAAPVAPKVMTITDPAVIARVAQLIDALPRADPGVRHCPAAFSTSLDLTFEATPHGPVAAKVNAAASGCREVSVTVHGTARPTLDGSDLIDRLQSLLHVRWPTLR